MALRGALRRDFRGWLAGLALFAAVAAGYQLFRWLYFHDLLPNTYYLKLTGVPLTVRLLRGLDGLQSFVRPQLPLLLAVAVGVVALLPRRPKLLLPAAVAAVYAAYAVAIGGDAWGQQADGPLTNRFLTFVMPLVFVLFAALVATGLAAWRAWAAVQTTGVPERLAALAMAVFALLMVDGLWPGPAAEVAWRRVLGIERPGETERSRRVVARLVPLREIAAPGATVATVWAGIPAYFTDYRMVDMLGYNDRRVARLPSRFVDGEDDWRRYRPGHDKLDLVGILEQRRPDVVFQLWGQGQRQLAGGPERLLRRRGYLPRGSFWVRAGSPWVRGVAAAGS